MKEVEQLYLDDLHVGQRFTSGSYVMEAARIKEFASELDPQPVHLDEAAAETSIFKGLAASGWHTAAAAMRLSLLVVCLSRAVWWARAERSPSIVPDVRVGRWLEIAYV